MAAFDQARDSGQTLPTATPARTPAVADGQWCPGPSLGTGLICSGIVILQRLGEGEESGRGVRGLDCRSCSTSTSQRPIADIAEARMYTGNRIQFLSTDNPGESQSHTPKEIKSPCEVFYIYLGCRKSCGHFVLESERRLYFSATEGLLTSARCQWLTPWTDALPGC